MEKRTKEYQELDQQKQKLKSPVFASREEFLNQPSQIEKLAVEGNDGISQYVRGLLADTKAVTQTQGERAGDEYFRLRTPETD